jgi:dihydrolipoamide dehydrogenase
VIDEFDCVVIGSGPGGYVSAIRAAQLGMRTAIIERESSMGGRCLHWACIPAKTVLRSADIVSEIRQAGEFGIDAGPPVVSFSRIAERRGQVITSLASGVRALLAKNRVEIIVGEARLHTERSIQIGDRTLRPNLALILATGSTRQAPPGIVFAERIIGTEEAWAFNQLPSSLAVLGAGASGAEIASGYARLGTQVHLFEYAERVLPAEDSDVCALVERRFRDQGIEVSTSAVVTNVHGSDEYVEFQVGDDHFQTEWLVVATGRRPDVDNLGLQPAGITLTEAGLVDVDRYQRTTADGIYAIGDLVGGPALAHKASEEGIVAVETAAGNTVAPMNYSNIPRATFCTPSVASVGLTEDAARAADYDVVVGNVPYSAVGAGTVYGDKRGLVKIIGDRTYGTILGAHIVGSKATELIQQFADAMHLEGGYPELARIVHGHPTLSEAVLEAARATDGWVIHG